MGTLSREQRHNLRALLGAEAVDTVERCVSKCNALELRLNTSDGRQAVVLQALAALKHQAAAPDPAITRRLNTLSGWCDKNEKAIVDLDNETLSHLSRMFESFDARQRQLESMTFVQRLRWVFFGRVPQPFGIQRWAFEPLKPIEGTKMTDLVMEDK